MFHRVKIISGIMIGLCVLGFLSGQGMLRADPELKKPATQLITEGDTLILDEKEYPEPGEAYGWVWNDRTGLLVPVFWEDTQEILKQGAGTCTSGDVPGMDMPVILAAHVYSYFNQLQYLEPGDVIHFDTWYGRFEYEVTGTCVYDQFELQAVLDEKLGYEEPSEQSRFFIMAEGTDGEYSDTVIYDRKVIELFHPDDEEKEPDTDPGNKDELWEEADDQAEMGSDPELILYTCYPFYAVPGEKTDRYTVFARKISGPHVIWQ